jgi:PAS domain S-box-containing protein
MVALFRRFPSMTSVHCTHPAAAFQLAPVTDYYLRKLLGRQMARLRPINPTIALSDQFPASATALVTRLKQVQGANAATIALQLETWVAQHQQLCSQGATHHEALRRTEAQIWDAFGLRITPAPSRGTILVIDDGPETLRLLTATLVDEGYEVCRSVDGAFALTRIHDIQPDLILLDIMMPGLDGYQICERLKADPKTCSIPVIFLSAVDQAQDKVKGFDLGAVDYITKPFQIEEVLARVAYQLRGQVPALVQTGSASDPIGADAYREFFENALDGCYQTTPEGKFIRANAALAKLLGYDSPESLIAAVTDITHQLYVVPQRRFQWLNYLRQYGQMPAFESELHHRSGHRIWVRETGRATYGPTGALQYLEGTVQEITDRRQGERHRQRQQLQADRLWIQILALLQVGPVVP